MSYVCCDDSLVLVVFRRDVGSWRPLSPDSLCGIRSLSFGRVTWILMHCHRRCWLKDCSFQCHLSGSAYPLSEDHKPNRKDQRQRIEQAGGVVIWAGTWRVGGILAVSRAFGDRSLKQFVVAEPELQEETIIDGVKFLILASDGLWDVVSNQDAVTLVETIPDAEEAAKSLVNEAIFKGSADNVTCIVICFHNGATEGHTETAA